jgi:hypothetical protein
MASLIPCAVFGVQPYGTQSLSQRTGDGRRPTLVRSGLPQSADGRSFCRLGGTRRPRPRQSGLGTHLGPRFLQCLARSLLSLSPVCLEGVPIEARLHRALPGFRTQVVQPLISVTTAGHPHDQ